MGEGFSSCRRNQKIGSIKERPLGRFFYFVFYGILILWNELI